MRSPKKRRLSRLRFRHATLCLTTANQEPGEAAHASVDKERFVDRKNGPFSVELPRQQAVNFGGSLEVGLKPAGHCVFFSIVEAGALVALALRQLSQTQMPSGC
ncbi:hypothetical protein KFL_000730210 [Klebsormidium nitens]|uniref:Uncharacterized protein n=1 Tax=Klebsormidium nitens TaxID=105231 RepID=A0A1Y1HRB8_KLENI|nr:hypothetical protein KFL_000730210 [Klebsormidium nitens]|eukprot:GAQ81184.1 hypothetical protein KFL_000730210 [Klebsormidium nitens]